MQKVGPHWIKLWKKSKATLNSIENFYLKAKLGSGGSGPEFIGFGLACQPTFRVRVHRISEVGKLSGLKK